MKRFLKAMFAVVVAVLAAFPAFAVQPGQTVNPNGFPSGDHYNLNIIGKKSGFTCPEQQYDLSGNLLYGNVIYVPETGTDIKIMMQSGTGTKGRGHHRLSGDRSLHHGLRRHARRLPAPAQHPGIPGVRTGTGKADG